MHAVLATVGTDGDVFPHLGLGAVLRGRGHRVTLAAPETYRGRALDLGLDFCSLVSARDVGRMLANPDLWHPLRSGPMMARWGGPMIPRQFELLAGLMRESDSALIANPAVLAARVVQEKLGCRTVSLLLQPGLVPSSTSPPEMVGGLTIPPRLPHPLRGVYWWGVDVAGYLLVAPALNRFRAALGMPPVLRLFRWWLSPDLVIGLFPAWYAAPQPDWPPQLVPVGFGRYDGSRAGLADDVRAFCAAGPPPVAFTLGTGMAHAAGFFRTAIEVCEAAGHRGLLLTKFPHLLPAKLPPSIRHRGHAPFRQLLPLCAAVVHHGGVGTTAAAIEAGCPQLVLPLAWDQPDNAARVVRLGLGACLGPRRRGRENLRRGLSAVMTEDVRGRCRAAAARAAGEDGFAVAADRMEHFAR